MIKISVRKKSPWQQSTIPDPVNTRGEYKKDQTKTVPPPVSAMKFPFYNFKNVIYKIRGFRKNLREEFFFTMQEWAENGEPLARLTPGQDRLQDIFSFPLNVQNTQIFYPLQRMDLRERYPKFPASLYISSRATRVFLENAQCAVYPAAGGGQKLLCTLAGPLFSFKTLLLGFLFFLLFQHFGPGGGKSAGISFILGLLLF